SVVGVRVGTRFGDQSRVLVVSVAGSPSFCFFFFQAEDGIRDDLVTGVQTCALPILPIGELGVGFVSVAAPVGVRAIPSPLPPLRSEERRVGKEGTARRSREDQKKKEVKEYGASYVSAKQASRSIAHLSGCGDTCGEQ